MDGWAVMVTGPSQFQHLTSVSVGLRPPTSQALQCHAATTTYRLVMDSGTGFMSFFSCLCGESGLLPITTIPHVWCRRVPPRPRDEAWLSGSLRARMCSPALITRRRVGDDRARYGGAPSRRTPGFDARICRNAPFDHAVERRVGRCEFGGHGARPASTWLWRATAVGTVRLRVGNTNSDPRRQSGTTRRRVICHA